MSLPLPSDVATRDAMAGSEAPGSTNHRRAPAMPEAQGPRALERASGKLR